MYYYMYNSINDKQKWREYTFSLKKFMQFQAQTNMKSLDIKTN